MPSRSRGKIEQTDAAARSNWLYRQLEQEYEYQTSNEAVDETLVVGGYTFTEEGRRFG